MVSNMCNGWVYIGSSRCVKVRIRQHWSQLRSNSHPVTLMQKDYNKGHEFRAELIKLFPYTVNGKRDMLTYERVILDQYEYGINCYSKRKPALEHPHIRPIRPKRFKIDILEGRLNDILAKGSAGTKTIEKLCKLLDCQPGDIMEFVKEEQHG